MELQLEQKVEKTLITKPSYKKHQTEVNNNVFAVSFDFGFHDQVEKVTSFFLVSGAL